MQYRIYADNSIVIEDEFKEHDNAIPFYDDYLEVSIPDILIEFIENSVLGK